MGPRRFGVLRLISWPYAIVTVLLLVLWLARVESPVTQLLDLATFWATLPAVGLVVVAVLVRDGRSAVLLAVPALTWVWCYGGAFLPSSPPDLAPDLRVVSFNTFVGVEGSAHVVALAEETEADVLLLQEVFGDRERELSTALGRRYPHWQVDRSPGVGAVVVASRHPIVDVIPINDPDGPSRSTSVVTLDVDGRRVQVASVHLISPCPVCGTSVLERLELEDDVRRAEVGAVLAALDPRVPAIVGGDLNSTDRSTAYRQLVAAGFDDAQRDAGRGMGFTWPANAIGPSLLRIDWVLVRDLVAVDAWVGDGRGSDHRPVVVDVAFRDGVGR